VVLELPHLAECVLDIDDMRRTPELRLDVFAVFPNEVVGLLYDELRGLQAVHPTSEAYQCFCSSETEKRSRDRTIVSPLFYLSTLELQPWPLNNILLIARRTTNLNLISTEL